MLKIFGLMFIVFGLMMGCAGFLSGGKTTEGICASVFALFFLVAGFIAAQD